LGIFNTVLFLEQCTRNVRLKTNEIGYTKVQSTSR